MSRFYDNLNAQDKKEFILGFATIIILIVPLVYFSIIKTKSVDICRCLTEPGNTKWSQENKDACNELISKEIGVDNWEKVNFSKDSELSAKWDALIDGCQ